MKKGIKKLIIGISTAAMLFSTSFNVFAFSPRTSLSTNECESIYWKCSSNCNVFQRNWSKSGGNCTWYAYGRAWELLGQKPQLSTGGAHKWYTYNDGYQRGSEPRLGAIGCWSDSNGTVGHVAVVEKIDGDTITMSESGWSYTNSFFAVKTRNKYSMDYSLEGVTRKFQGYIYLPISTEQEVKNTATAPEEMPQFPCVDIRDIMQMVRENAEPHSRSGIQIYLNNRYLPLSDEAVNLGNTVIVPARDFIEALGGSVSWNNDTKKLTSYINNSTFCAQLNSDMMYINNIPIKANAPVTLNVDGKAMLPLRTTATVLGARIVNVDANMNIYIAD